MTDHKIIIYTDGACSGNPGAGGWGAVLIYQGLKEEIIKEVCGGEEQTTNNRMEMSAVIFALKELKKTCEVDLYTDSQYVMKGITEWMNAWLRSNWKNGKVKNIDLWQELLVLCGRHKINWHWVRGHSGDLYNEKADELAHAGIAKISKKIVK